MIPSRFFIIAVALTVFATPAPASPVSPTTCARELAVTETNLLKTAIRLQAASRLSQDEKCATYRTHADVVTKARQVFERCSTGRDREQDVGQMDGALSQIETAIASICALQ
jgi:hypothetical protein